MGGYSSKKKMKDVTKEEVLDLAAKMIQTDWKGYNISKYAIKLFSASTPLEFGQALWGFVSSAKEKVPDKPFDVEESVNSIAESAKKIGIEVATEIFGVSGFFIKCLEIYAVAYSGMADKYIQMCHDCPEVAQDWMDDRKFENECLHDF